MPTATAASAGRRSRTATPSRWATTGPAARRPSPRRGARRSRTRAWRARSSTGSPSGPTSSRPGHRRTACGPARQGGRADRQRPDQQPVRGHPIGPGGTRLITVGHLTHIPSHRLVTTDDNKPDFARLDRDREPAGHNAQRRLHALLPASRRPGPRRRPHGTGHSRRPTRGESPPRVSNRVSQPGAALRSKQRIEVIGSRVVIVSPP
jgi:hypothetical protein